MRGAARGSAAPADPAAAAAPTRRACISAASADGSTEPGAAAASGDPGPLPPCTSPSTVPTALSAAHHGVNGGGVAMVRSAVRASLAAAGSSRQPDEDLAAHAAAQPGPGAHARAAGGLTHHLPRLRLGLQLQPPEAAEQWGSSGGIVLAVADSSSMSRAAA